MSRSTKREWTSLPPDMMALAGIYFVPLVMVVAICLVLPAIDFLRQLGRIAGPAFILAVFSAVVGMVLLFLAKLPLYRQRQFFTFGPRRLDHDHRIIYWLAYAFVGASVSLLLLLGAAVGR